MAAPTVTAGTPPSFNFQLVSTTSAAVTDVVTGQWANRRDFPDHLSGRRAVQWPRVRCDTSGATTSQTVSYTFSPAATGSFSQNVIATDTGAGSNSITLTLTGTGVAPLASGTVTNATVANFVLVGQTSSVALSVANGRQRLPGCQQSQRQQRIVQPERLISGGNSVFVGNRVVDLAAGFRLLRDRQTDLRDLRLYVPADHHRRGEHHRGDQLHGRCRQHEQRRQRDDDAVRNRCGGRWYRLPPAAPASFWSARPQPRPSASATLATATSPGWEPSAT